VLRLPARGSKREADAVGTAVLNVDGRATPTDDDDAAASIDDDSGDYDHDQARKGSDVNNDRAPGGADHRATASGLAADHAAGGCAAILVHVDEFVGSSDDVDAAANAHVDLTRVDEHDRQGHRPQCERDAQLRQRRSRHRESVDVAGAGDPRRDAERVRIPAAPRPSPRAVQPQHMKRS